MPVSIHIAITMCTYSTNPPTSPSASAASGRAAHQRGEAHAASGYIEPTRGIASAASGRAEPTRGIASAAGGRAEPTRGVASAAMAGKCLTLSLPKEEVMACNSINTLLRIHPLDGGRVEMII